MMFLTFFNTKKEHAALTTVTGIVENIQIATALRLGNKVSTFEVLLLSVKVSFRQN